MEDKIFNAWLAGFWEGEGSLTKFKSKNVYRITLTQCIKDGRGVELCFNKIKQRFGGNYYKIIPRKKNHSITLRYHLDQRDDVLNFIKTIYPYCQIRKKQIEDVLEYFKTHHRGNSNFHSKTKYQHLLILPY
ncbi:MAG: hypothetical protein KAW56_07245 [Candidatus Marinimicrobia bacterium]|nr:hypothetical protein [Candidatus Neomarinimicrobiota bacterium]